MLLYHLFKVWMSGESLQPTLWPFWQLEYWFPSSTICHWLHAHSCAPPVNVHKTVECKMSMIMSVDLPCISVYIWMNENLYIAHKKLPHKTLRVHSTRYTGCIHVSSCKLYTYHFFYLLGNTVTVCLHCFHLLKVVLPPQNCTLYCPV